MDRKSLYKYIYYFLAFIVALPIGRSYALPADESTVLSLLDDRSGLILTSDDQNYPASLSLIMLEEISEEIEEDTEEKTDYTEGSDIHPAQQDATSLHTTLAPDIAAYKSYNRTALTLARLKYFVLFHSWKSHLH